MTDITLLTRQSTLALWQANATKTALEASNSTLSITLSKQSTLGDRDKTTPLIELGNKHSFVSELQQLLLTMPNAAAVHSLKDLSVHPHPKLSLCAFLPRADARDVLISKHKNVTLNSLPPGAIVGTGSPRRCAQIKAIRPDLELRDIRGNVSTRIDKCLNGGYDAIILAAAGLHRLERHADITEYLSIDLMLPAIGQGIIAVECLRENTALIEQLSLINDPQAEACAKAERSVNVILGGNCHTPIAAHAECKNDTLHLSALVLSHDGKEKLLKAASAPITDAEALGTELANQLIAAGAKKLLGS